MDPAALPPLLQVALLCGLGAFSALSVAARLTGRLAWLWREPPEERGVEHVLQYTVVPIVVTLACAGRVIGSWDPAAPWLGTWSLAAVLVGGLGVGGGVALAVTGAVLGTRWDLGDASSARAWVPLVLVLGGVALLAAGILLPSRL